MHTNKRLRVHKTYLGFDRRATALAWHPTNPNVVAVGSKGGDIILWNYQADGNKPRTFIKGVGPGGSIQSLQFDERHSGYKAYTVSIDGTLAYHDLEAEERKNFLMTGDIEILNIPLESKYSNSNVEYSVVGCKGQGKKLEILDLNLVPDSEKGSGAPALGANGSIQALKFNTDNPNLAYTASINGNMECQDVTRGHCHKVFLSTGDCEHTPVAPWSSFVCRMPWCFVTASVDRSLKVWDIRNLKSRSSCLYSHIHERPVNSAHFSRTDGGRLLTTDQHSEMRVYSCPSFTLSRTISHPHRQFQHLTPIKATWHPLRDIIVVGRYPDPAFPGYVDNEPRTVDFFDGATGKLLHQHMDKGCDNKIISLNLFNQTGDALLSSAALLVWVWKPKFSCDASKGSLDSEGNSDDDDDDSNDKPKRPRKKRTNNTALKRSKAPKEMKVVRGIMKIDRKR
nr:DNA damage-binding protein 2-like [Penaeus vannamei]